MVRRTRQQRKALRLDGTSLPDMAIMRFAAARAPEQRSEVLHSPQGQASGFLLFSPALNNSCRIGFITTTESLSKVDLDGELATEL